MRRRMLAASVQALYRTRSIDLSSQSIPWRPVIIWGLVGALLAAAFTTAVLQGAASSAAGTAASVTASPSSPAPSPQQKPAGPVSAAPEAAPGKLPGRAALEQRLKSQDVAALTKGVQEGSSLSLAYQVLDIETGDVLAASNADQLLVPASNTKLLTVTALLSVFDGTETFDTTVVSPAPGQLVLVGGGDPLLASAASGGHPKRASLEELAAKTAEKLKSQGLSKVTLGYDASLFQESWATTWLSGYRDQVTPISALWADEGRDAKQVRSTDPAGDAARIFATQLAAQGITVEGSPATAKGSGEEIAKVSSPGVHAIAAAALETSNNSYTEVLGMQLARKLGQPTTFAGTAAAVQQELTRLGLWHEGAVLYDGSGLTRENHVTASMLAGVVRYVMITPRASVVQEGFPVAGVSGSLTNRFDDEISTAGRGIVRAKTGTLSLVSTLAGTTVTADGREVAFAFMTNGSTDGWAAQVWSDRGAALITGCGC